MGSKTVIFIVQAVTLDRLYKIQELAKVRLNDDFNRG
jgi:hypothetical protein